jgi:hypothetical protein
MQSQPLGGRRQENCDLKVSQGKLSVALSQKPKNKQEDWGLVRVVEPNLVLSSILSTQKKKTLIYLMRYIVHTYTFIYNGIFLPYHCGKFEEIIVPHLRELNTMSQGHY